MTDYRSKALAEYGRLCQECGATENIEVHHTDRDRDNNQLSNLEVLCRSCHADRHTKIDGERVDVSVPVSEDLNDILEGQLEYGDSKAGYIRGACQMRLGKEQTQK